MKRIMEYIFISFLIIFSFFYTDKVIDMVNKKDPLMEEIINVSDEYILEPVDATIFEDTIIPGMNGKIIDVDKSYEIMKLGGIFRVESLIFKDLYPGEILGNNKDKYIIKGNNQKNEVALITIFNSINVSKINNSDIITVFINHKDLNINNIKLLKEKEIYTYGNNGVYDSEILVGDNTLINRMSSNNSKYCLVKSKDNNSLQVCSENDMYTVIPNIVGNYYEVKNNLANGSIILLNNLNDVDIVIKYIKSKGYNIVRLDDLLSE